MTILGPWWGSLHSPSGAWARVTCGFSADKRAGPSGPRVRPRWGGERVLGSEGSLAQRGCRRAAEEVSVSYSFVYFTCSLTVSFKVIYVAEALLYFNHMVIILFC